MVRFALPFLVVLAPLAACSSEQVSTKGQMITCTTDPGTGVIARCVPGQTPPAPGGNIGSGGSGSGSGSGEGSGSGGTGTCHDVDEDGDGEPHDVGETEHALPGDQDGDGVPDDDDCDEHPGEDDSPESADLPYDVKPQLGTTATPVVDAFLENSTTAPTIVSVTMDGGGSWRLTELQTSTPFMVTQADCDHAGNRDVGRDRVIVTWQNADGSTAADHLDIRYCEPL